jgi:predicted RNase H-like nuclease
VPFLEAAEVIEGHVVVVAVTKQLAYLCTHSKAIETWKELHGVSEFPNIGQHIERRPREVRADDLLDSAAAAWSALRLLESSAEFVCRPIHDARGLRIAIHY